jgi:hypothetical protein
MVMREVWLGSTGPFLFDDEDYNGLTTNGGITSNDGAMAGTIDPSIAPGVAATPGSIFGRNNSGVGELWLKTGVNNTSWTRIA